MLKRPWWCTEFLETICCRQGGIVIFFSLLATGILASILPLLNFLKLFMRGNFLYLYFKIFLPIILGLTIITVFYSLHVTVFYSLKIHGIRNEKPQYIKAFIISMCFLLIFFNTGFFFLEILRSPVQLSCGSLTLVSVLLSMPTWSMKGGCKCEVFCTRELITQ